MEETSIHSKPNTCNSFCNSNASLNEIIKFQQEKKRNREEKGVSSRGKRTRPSPPHKTSGQLDSLHPIIRNPSITPRRDFSSWNEESIYDFMPPPRQRVNRRLCASRPADLEFSLISRCVFKGGTTARQGKDDGAQ